MQEQSLTWISITTMGVGQENMLGYSTLWAGDMKIFSKILIGHKLTVITLSYYLPKELIFCWLEGFDIESIWEYIN